MPDFDIPESTSRSAFRRTLYFQTGWMMFVGAVLLAMPERRFSSPSWQFIEIAPHGDDILGALYVTLGVVMAVMMRRDKQRLLGLSVGCAGMLNWTLGVFLLAGALNGSMGGLGFPMALYPGGHMILTATTLWRKR